MLIGIRSAVRIGPLKVVLWFKAAGIRQSGHAPVIALRAGYMKKDTPGGEPPLEETHRAGVIESARPA